MFALREKTGMRAKAISHVLSVLRLPLDRSLFEGFEHLVIEVDDVEGENLIEHFATTNAFVEKAVANGGAVLIHWYVGVCALCVSARLLNDVSLLSAMGKSRSATVLAAYLMKSRQLEAKEAVQLIRQYRPFVEPNPGFMAQLEVYHQMNYTTDLDGHPIYQRWLYKKELGMSKAAGLAPERVHFRDAENNVAELARVKEGETPELVGLIELRCKTCRYCLPPNPSSMHASPIHCPWQSTEP